MEKIITLTSITLVAFLSGCTTYYSHPYKDTQQFHQENAQCMAMANSGGSNYQIMPTYGTGYGQSFANGWNQGAAIGAASQRDRIYKSCMLGNGWSPDK